jgi:polyferredoxin
VTCPTGSWVAVIIFTGVAGKLDEAFDKFLDSLSLRQLKILLWAGFLFLAVWSLHWWSGI